MQLRRRTKSAINVLNKLSMGDSAGVLPRDVYILHKLVTSSKLESPRIFHDDLRSYDPRVLILLFY